MEVGRPLRKLSNNGTKRVLQIEFIGDRLNTEAVGSWREEALMQLRSELPADSKDNLAKWAGTEASPTPAIVFMDILGRRQLGKKAVDADWDRIREQHVALGASLIQKLDGFLAKTMSDGLMAIFRNAPSALNFMLEMRQKDGAVVEDLRQVAHAGSAPLGQDDAFRLHVDFTARMSREAQEGDIVVSDRFKGEVDVVAKLEHRGIHWERIIGVSFKGFPDKFDLWKLGRQA